MCWSIYPSSRLHNRPWLLLAGAWLGAIAVQAQDATWLPNPGSGDWNTAAHWAPATVPTRTATFGGSNTPIITFSNDASIGALQFRAGAPAYSFLLSSTLFTINGAGVLNHSSNSPMFSTIGNVVGIDRLSFLGAATAANASITNNSGGITNFFNSSTAGNSTIFNNAGFTLFHQASTADRASITNISGFTKFFDASTAGRATLIDGPNETSTFEGTSTAAHANITNNGGGLGFSGASTAANATIINNAGGVTNFANTSSTGNATIINNAGGATSFLSTSTAANFSITNNAGGATAFLTTSTAGHATITNNDGGLTLFFSNSGAGDATIVTRSGGSTLFFSTSTGDQARFVTEAGGIVDISGLSSGTMTAGSIEGAGAYRLGSNTLTVGLNNRSTEVNGSIDNGGNNDGTGAALIKVGTGTLTLTGPNNYSGGTTLNGGILAVNSDANLGTGPLRFGGGTLQALAAGGGINSAKAITLSPAGGTFFSDAGTTSNLTGAINGPGSLTKDGSGTLSLAGANNYSGGTKINEGVLAVRSDANLGRGALIFNGGTLQTLMTGRGITSTKAVTLNGGGGTFLADARTNSTLSGAISGSGSLTKEGPGTLILSGANSYAGGTVLKAGMLTVLSPRALGLGNVVVNGGTLNSASLPINVSGNYTQTAGGKLQLQVAGANPGQYDSLNVGGNASLGGTLQLISLGFQPKPGDLLTLITTGGMVSGRFAQFIDPFAPSQESNKNILELLYGPNSVRLLFLNFDLAASVTGLTAFYEISFSNANIQRLNLEGRLDDIHYGSNGFNSNMKINGATVNLEVASDGKSSKGVVEPILQPGPENRWGVWVTGFGDFVNVDSEGNAKGYDFTTGGVSLGVDYRITDQLAIGVMGEYSHTWTSLQPSGHIDVDSGRGGLYATWYHHGIYLNGAIYGGHNNYDSSRTSLGGQANGGTEGAEWSTFVGGGYDFHFGHLTAGPIAALQYTYVNVNGFSEHGSLAPMQIHSDSAESLRSDVGLRLFYQWQIGKVVVEPSLKAAWEHEYKYSALPITAGFAGIPGPAATFFGPSEGHDSAVVSAGVSVQLTPTLTTYVNYDGQLGRQNYDSNAVTGGVRISF